MTNLVLFCAVLLYLAVVLVGLCMDFYSKKTSEKRQKLAELASFQKKMKLFQY